MGQRRRTGWHRLVWRNVRLWYGLPRAVHLLGSAQLLGQRGIHIQIGAAALAAPQALLGNTLSQTLHGAGAEFLRTAMGTDLDVRHVLLQRLVLPCRAAQRIVFRLYGGELLLQGKNNLQAPWLGIAAFLSVAVLLTLLIFIGEAVRDAFDPSKAV